MEKVLLVDDDREVREALAQTLELADLKPVLAGSFIEAKDQIKAQFEGIIVTDIRMPGRDGFHLLNYARETDPDLPVILLTGEADVPMAVQAMAQGAHAFLEKPCAPADLIAAIRLALEQRREVLAARRRQLQIESGDAAERMLHGGSDLAKSLRSRVRAVARTTAEVLVTGPPGSGIPKVAEVIHLLSPAAHRPFVKTAGGALDVAGLFEAIDKAKGGALYIDEVGNLSAAAQFALLDKSIDRCLRNPKAICHLLSAVKLQLILWFKVGLFTNHFITTWLITCWVELIIVSAACALIFHYCPGLLMKN